MLIPSTICDIGEEFARERTHAHQSQRQSPPADVPQLPESTACHLQHVAGSRLLSLLQEQTSTAAASPPDEAHLQMLLHLSMAVLCCQAGITQAAGGTESRVDSLWKASGPLLGELLAI